MPDLGRPVLVMGAEPGSRPLPDWLAEWLGASAPVDASPEDVAPLLQRMRPSVVLVDGRTAAATFACRLCKDDAYAALVPCVVFGAHPGDGSPTAFFEAGADEVLTAGLDASEARARLERALERSRRDLAAQPTTGLPGPPAIEREIDARLTREQPFAACYADLDHFKEFNDRYGFREGDRVIRMVGRMLRDVARGVGGARAFVGHIGGDDFLCVVPLADAVAFCEAAVETFDLLAPLQYSAADRRAGYYLGKDRRGQLHRVPLMTLSIGVVTTERRRLTSSAEVSRLASEMKSFAKTRAGSCYAFDRRSAEPEIPADTLSDAP